MSQENVEIVRRVYAEWERGDFRTLDCFDPEVRVVWVDEMFARGSESKGVRSLARNMGEFLGAWDGATASAERIVAAGEQVVVLSCWRGRGKASGIEVATRLGSVWTMRDGKVVQMENYADPGKALAAVGLSE